MTDNELSFEVYKVDTETTEESTLGPSPQDDSPEDIDIDENSDDQDSDQGGDGENFTYSEDEDANVVAYYDWLKANGNISDKNDERFDGTVESLHKIMYDHWTGFEEKVGQTIVGSLPGFLQPVVQAALSGEEVTYDKAKEIFGSTQVSQFENLDIEDEGNAEAFLKFYLQKYEDKEPDEIQDELDLLSDKGKLLTRAKRKYERYTNLVKTTNEKLTNQYSQKSKNKTEQKRQIGQQFVTNLKEQEWNSEHKQRIYQSYTSGDFAKRVEHMVNNPKVLPLLVDLALRGYNGQELDLSFLEKKVKSKATEALKRKLQNTQTRKGTKRRKEENEITSDNIFDNFTIDLG